MKLSGIILAIIELFIFYNVSKKIRIDHVSLYQIDTISYYWLMFTVLTAIWEFTYVLHRNDIRKLSNKLIIKKEHVWTKQYELNMLYPWNFSTIFYSEYGAYADKEYALITDIWSELIEGTHAIFCGIFAFIAIMCQINKNNEMYEMMVCISMASQLMNSILYMGEYLIQTKSKYNVNYDRPKFPCGWALNKRPFMYINIFWTLMPLDILYHMVL